MDSHRRTAHDRQRILAEGERSGDVSAVCEAHDISRTIYYRWARRLEAEGLAGLQEKSRSHKSHPHSIGPDVEAQIVALVTNQPNLGCRGIANAMTAAGVRVSFKSIQRIVERRCLGRTERWMMLEEKFRRSPDALSHAQMRYLIDCNPGVSQYTLRPDTPGACLVCGRFRLPRRLGLSKNSVVVIADMFTGFVYADTYPDVTGALNAGLLFFGRTTSRKPQAIITSEPLALMADKFSGLPKDLRAEPILCGEKGGYVRVFQIWLEKKLSEDIRPRPWMTPDDAFSHWVEYYNFQYAPLTFPQYGRTPASVLRDVLTMI